MQLVFGDISLSSLGALWELLTTQLSLMLESLFHLMSPSTNPETMLGQPPSQTLPVNVSSLDLHS